MEARDILRQFEVTLPEQVLQDVMTPGKTFQKEIWVPESVQNDAEKQSCILLNKTSDTLLKLLVTVYKVETTEAGTQEQRTTSSQHTQAGQHGTSGPNGDVAAENGQPAEPAAPVMCDSSMQTEHEPMLESGVQTEEKEMMTSSVQTNIKEEATTASQTDVAALCDTDAQTDELEMFEQETQVELVMADNVTQTIIKEYQASVSQTDISTGLRSEVDCQATVAVQSSETQVIIEVEEVDCQTHIDVEDGVCQTEVELSDNVTQTEIELKNNVCQTDIAEITEGGMQTEPWQGVDKETQNVAEVQFSESQTDMSMALQEEGSTQVELVQDEKEVQTEAEEPATSGPAGDPGLPLSQTSNTSSNVDASQDSDIPDANLDQPELSIEEKSKDVQDDSCQTDPVTIIIGDASFLMQKIRSSAISPTKVSGSGNEIEIEVQADEGYHPSGQDSSGATSMKAATPSPRRVPPRRGHPRGGPATRGGSRGARTLPPRQPLQSPSPGHVSTQPRRVQHPPAPAPMVIQPRREQQDRKLPAAGGRGKYSCPFCAITFHESPSLYEHLQNEHHSDTVSKHSKPKGREGKTIVPRMPTSAIPGEGDPSMPVLVPVERSRSGQQGPQQYHVVRNVVQEDADDEGIDEEQEVLVVEQPEEPGLFEEPMEPIIRKIKKRVLEEAEAEAEERGADKQQTVVVSQQSQKVVGVVQEIVPEEDEDEVEEEEEEVRPKAVKRKRGSSVTGSPRRKKLELEVEEEVEEVEDDEPEPPQSRLTRKSMEQARTKAESPRSTRSHVVARGRGGRRGRRS